MKIIAAILFSGALLLISGCMKEYVPLKISPSHPASIEAEESSIYKFSTTLDKQNVSDSSREEYERNKNKQGKVDPMKSMKGMNHNGH